MGNIRNPFRSIVLLVLVTMAGNVANAARYHLSSSGGDDNAAGTDPGSAWKSLGKINGTTFKAGDTVLLAAGGMWTGQFHPKGSGSAASPIILDTFGIGNRPILNGGGVTGNATLYLFHQSFWEVRNLEITNNAATAGDRRGVLITGPCAHIHLTGLSIHDIKGIVGQDGAAKATGGISFDGDGDDILVEKCSLAKIDNTGLFTDGNYTRLRFRNNSINDIAKNAIILRGADSTCVVEYNVCYNTAARATTGNMIFSTNCNGTVFQFNEGYLNKATGPFDGSLYDLDINGGSNTKWQYSYSHDNAYGFMWFCCQAADTGVVVRYNISQNDKRKIFSFVRDLGGTSIYNNVVYVDPGLSPSIVSVSHNYSQKVSFYNNIIYNLSATADYVFNTPSAHVFDYNVFFGKHPASEPKDAHKLTSDPMFKNPGAGAIGLNTLAGYALQPGSPCINSGKTVPHMGPRDFFGNPLGLDAPDRGVFEASNPLPARASRPFPQRVPAHPLALYDARGAVIGAYAGPGSAGVANPGRPKAVQRYLIRSGNRTAP